MLTNTHILTLRLTHMHAHARMLTFFLCQFLISVCLSVIAAAVREMFEKTDFYKTSDKQCLFMTVHDAVLYAQRLLAIVEGVRTDFVVWFLVEIAFAVSKYLRCV